MKDGGCEPDINRELLEDLLGELMRVREYMLDQAVDLADQIAMAHPNYSASALNLAHYLALRQHDLRSLQEELALVGLSSLGRCESHALASVEAVIRAARALIGESGHSSHLPGPHIAPSVSGRAQLVTHTEDLLGPEPPERSVRIMVTLPTEAGTDYTLVRKLVGSGMDCARINCAHDNLEIWRAMALHVRQAAHELERPCRILVDVAGPKLRTADLPPGPAVVVWKPRRDALRGVVEPARVLLTAGPNIAWSSDGFDAALTLPADWLSQLRGGDIINLRDARGKRRQLLVTDARPDGCSTEARQTAYVVEGTEFRIGRRSVGRQPRVRSCRIAALEPAPGALVLRTGDVLVIAALDSVSHRGGWQNDARRIACTLPPDLTGIAPGDALWFDDGKIGGRIRRVSPHELEVEITQAKPGGSKLRADRSVNLPDSQLERAPLLSKDLADLAFVAEHADLVGLSFAESAEGIQQLASALHERTEREIGIVLKIETRRGFERLPQLLLAAMRNYPVGVMIARGDLAIECGYERLAEVQEEMLWLCEAAHLPVIWATQVLDQLTRTGQPSRAEITDAAMSGRAECVMLNKGPHIVQAVCTLSDILARMQAHQQKKRSLFRKLLVSELENAD
jgi:pyruvate kinase